MRESSSVTTKPSLLTSLFKRIAPSFFVLPHPFNHHSLEENIWRPNDDVEEADPHISAHLVQVRECPLQPRDNRMAFLHTPSLGKNTVVDVGPGIYEETAAAELRS